MCFSGLKWWCVIWVHCIDAESPSDERPYQVFNVLYRSLLKMEKTNTRLYLLTLFYSKQWSKKKKQNSECVLTFTKHGKLGIFIFFIYFIFLLYWYYGYVVPMSSCSLVGEDVQREILSRVIGSLGRLIILKSEFEGLSCQFLYCHCVLSYPFTNS